MMVGKTDSMFNPTLGRTMTVVDIIKHPDIEAIMYVNKH